MVWIFIHSCRNEISELKENIGKLELDCANVKKQFENEESLHKTEQEAKGKLQTELENLLKEYECSKSDMGAEIEKLKTELSDTKKTYVSRSNEQSHKQTELEGTIAQLEAILATTKEEKDAITLVYHDNKTNMEEQIGLVSTSSRTLIGLILSNLV